MGTFRPDHIIIHHSASKDGNAYDALTIREMHLGKGWSDVGYHALVEQVDDEFIVTLGRPLNIMGAHAKGFNERSIGICFIGNYHEYAPNELMIDEAVKRFIGPVSLLLNIHPSRILPHKAVGTTATVCPGKYFPLPYLQDKVSGYWK